ncbi:1,2-phenylacetyl-CoA epoxidase subunit PaaE [Nocardiopsis composta]|uniref:Ring-1,2-phenylacetyl-CoA epoxidase subunit PaaE n=1 Tax=Nocardiopsis composta TaxID=157465 RepID=A0A7W8QRP3_9ACTN|nr:1,2-phenylacetyl-CoA epoxidase subunit PaaE [Nocardiopsis composta]MBB5434376.1 ring-1,2-phenylacetyl-CoA epoxidase subunit PaaE [Nocardiopsis composta]
MTAATRERGAVPARRRGVFHPLTVASVERLTDDAVAVTFDVPPELAEEFRFEQGQHITVRRVSGGEEVRRNYSICSPAPDGPLRIGVKRLEGGAFSAFANDELKPGDTVDVMPPLGRFNVPLRPEEARTHVAIAAGSGITPVLSLIATTLRDEPESTFTLVYANRTARDVMFLEELSDLKDVHPARFQLLNVLSREQGEAPLTSGRVDREKLGALLTAIGPAAGVAHWYLCGPLELVDAVRTDLAGRGVPAERIHFELFHVEEGAPPPRRRGKSESAASTRLAFTLDGRTTTVDTDPDEPLLTAALRVRADAPYACRGGVCGTCRARLCEGTVDMPRNYALEPAELAAGYILTCQSRPTSESVTVDYDA